MKYLKKYNESLDDIDSIKMYCEDILLDLTDDGIMCLVQTKVSDDNELMGWSSEKINIMIWDKSSWISGEVIPVDDKKVVDMQKYGNTLLGLFDYLTSKGFRLDENLSHYYEYIPYGKCPKCGSSDISRTNFIHEKTYICNQCGTIEDIPVTNSISLDSKKFFKLIKKGAKATRLNLVFANYN